MGENTVGADSDPAAQAVEGLADITDDDAYAASDEEVGPMTRGGGGGGGKYLTDLADALRDGGLNVKEYSGWETRARGGGGLRSGPLGIILHHTASGPKSNGQNDADFLAKSHKHAPISNLYLDRQGTWWVLAAGGTNTNGKGGPWGPIPQNDANPRVIGIEAGNNGVGEPWPVEMQDSYVSGVAALAERYGISTENILSHHEWTSRKIDPAGPSKFGSINRAQTWEMNKFRQAVDIKRGASASASLSSTTKRSKRPDANVYVVKPGDTWWSISDTTMGDPAKNWSPLADANGGQDSMLLVGAVLTIPGGAQPTSAANAPSTQFPGEAKLGTTGPVVLTWQKALIASGTINDSAGNRDSNYGEGLERAVLALQQSWGWSNADGIAGSGTWKRLHEVS
jgi:hypothetical protein